MESDKPRVLVENGYIDELAGMIGDDADIRAPLVELKGEGYTLYIEHTHNCLKITKENDD
jgi:hypothetical protein